MTNWPPSSIVQCVAERIKNEAMGVARGYNGFIKMITLETILKQELNAAFERGKQQAIDDITKRFKGQTICYGHGNYRDIGDLIQESTKNEAV